jgi:hypothetical protein
MRPAVAVDIDPEVLADLTRHGEVLICHPDQPDAPPVGVQPESVTHWTSRGWERYCPPAPPKTAKKATTKSADAPKDKE